MFGQVYSQHTSVQARVHTHVLDYVQSAAFYFMALTFLPISLDFVSLRYCKQQLIV